MVYSAETGWMAKPVPVPMHVHDEPGIGRKVVLADYLAKLHPGADESSRHVSSSLRDLRDVAVHFLHVWACRKKGFRHLGP